MAGTDFDTMNGFRGHVEVTCIYLSLNIKILQDNITLGPFFTRKNRDIYFSFIVRQISPLVGHPSCQRRRLGHTSKDGKVRRATNVQVLKVPNGFETVSEIYAFLPSADTLLSFRADLVF